MLRYYHYRRLTSVGQQAYRKIAEAIRRYAPYAVIDYVQNLQVLIGAVRDDNPHFFYVDFRKTIYSTQLGGARTVVYLKYHIGRDEAKRYLSDARAIAEGLRREDDAATVRAVHDYLASRVRYNHDSVRADRYYFSDHNMLGPLFGSVGVCEGIARATQFLLRELQVECTYYSGYVRDAGAGNSGYHAWNLVRLKGTVMKMDVTWDLAEGSRVSYQYFCVPWREGA